MHLVRRVGNTLPAKLLPSPLEGEGLEERGAVGCDTSLTRLPGLPLSLTLSLQGKGDKTRRTPYFLLRSRSTSSFSLIFASIPRSAGS